MGMEIHTAGSDTILTNVEEIHEKLGEYIENTSVCFVDVGIYLGSN